MKAYRGIVESHQAMKSSKKQTPGIEFIVSVRQVKIGNDFKDCQWMEKTVTLWFPPGSDPAMNLRKLAFAGHDGGSLRDMNLVGNTVELIGTMETYKNRQRERFELGLPGRAASAPDDDAFAAIDAVLGASDAKSSGRRRSIRTRSNRPTRSTRRSVGDRRELRPVKKLRVAT